MKTILFYVAYFAVGLGANALIGWAGVHGWPEWPADISCDVVIYSLLRGQIEPGWWRLNYKSRWFIIR